MPKASPYLYVRRKKAKTERSELWEKALSLQSRANEAYIDDLNSYKLLQQAAEACAEKFLQMDERVQYLTLRIYWESGKAEYDPDAPTPENFVISLFHERERRAQARKRYWNEEARPEDALPVSNRMQSKLEKLRRPDAPDKHLLTEEKAREASEKRQAKKKEHEEKKAYRAALRLTLREKTAPERAERRRLKDVERARQRREKQRKAKDEEPSL